MNLFVIFFYCLLISTFLTPVIIKFFISKGIVDKPDARRINLKIVPRMGGVIIIFVTSIVILISYKTTYSVSLLLLAASFIFITGVYDDIAGLKWYFKFFFQFAAVGFVLFQFKHLISNLYFFGLFIPYPLNYILFLFFVVGVVNSINLMDGLDGLVSGFSLLVFSVINVLTIIQPDNLIATLSIALIGSLAGYIKYNAYPAKIFLGDTGSYFLGFCIAVLSIKTSINFGGGALELGFPIVLLAVPIIDTLKVFSIRILNGKSPFLPDKNHLHHLLLDAKIGHKFTVFIIQIINIFFALSAIQFLLRPTKWVFLQLILGVFVIIYSPGLLKRYNTSKAKQSFYEGFKRIPEVVLSFLKKGFIFLTVPAVAYLIYVNFPLRTSLSAYELFPVLIVTTLLFLSIVVNYFRNINFTHEYFFLNIFLFYFVNNAAHPLLDMFTTMNSNVSIISLIVIIFLGVLTLFFFLSKSILDQIEHMFLYGFDLLIIVVILFVFFIGRFIGNSNQFSILGLKLLIAFLIYMIYKIVVYLKPESAFILMLISYLLLTYGLLQIV